MKRNDKQRLFEVMSRLDKTFKPNLREEVNIDESGFARVKQMMHGLVENINTIGILSAENPGPRRLSSEENNKRTEMLKKRLRTMGLGFVQPDFGMYGDKENSLIVQNIYKKDLIKLSNAFGQESCIFGSKQKDSEGVYVKWEYIENGVTQGEQTVYTNLAGSDVQSSEDFYTQVKGRKFKIPFFDDENPQYKEPKSDYKYKSDDLYRKFNISIMSND